MSRVFHIHIQDRARRRRDEWGGFPDPSPRAVAAARETFPEDSRFGESAINDPDDVLRRIKAASGVSVLRQVLSELETARKEDVIEIARRFTGRKAVSTKKAIDDIWTTWYTRRGTADAEWREEEPPRAGNGQFGRGGGGARAGAGGSRGAVRKALHTEIRALGHTLPQAASEARLRQAVQSMTWTQWRGLTTMLGGKKSPAGGEELFYVDKSGRKQDADFHNEILVEGEDEPGAFDELLEKLGLTEAFAATFKEGDGPLAELDEVMPKTPKRGDGR